MWNQGLTCRLCCNFIAPRRIIDTGDEVIASLKRSIDLTKVPCLLKSAVLRTDADQTLKLSRMQIPRFMSVPTRPSISVQAPGLHRLSCMSTRLQSKFNRPLALAVKKASNDGKYHSRGNNERPQYSSLAKGYLRRT